MHIVVCKNTNIQRHKYTQPLTVKMKATIMPCNCAARSSLFSDAPRPHGAPFQPNMPPLDGTLSRERDAVPTSTSNWCALFICLYLFKLLSWSRFQSRLTPAAACGEEGGIFSSVLNRSALFFCLYSFFSRGVGCSAGFCFFILLSENCPDKSTKLGFNTR